MDGGMVECMKNQLNFNSVFLKSLVKQNKSTIKNSWMLNANRQQRIRLQLFTKQLLEGTLLCMK